MLKSFYIITFNCFSLLIIILMRTFKDSATGIVAYIMFVPPTPDENLDVKTFSFELYLCINNNPFSTDTSGILLFYTMMFLLCFHANLFCR